MMGILEGIYLATTMVTMPIWADQHRNAYLIRNQGIAICVPWEEATLQIFKEAIIEQITNNK